MANPMCKHYANSQEGALHPPLQKTRHIHTETHIQNVRCSVNIFNLSGSIQHLRTKEDMSAKTDLEK